MPYTAGNGGATECPKVLSRSLRHSDLSATRKAAELACVVVGESAYEPTIRELSQYHKVPEVYIRVACTWSPEKRMAVAKGKDATTIAPLLAPPMPVFLLEPPAPKKSDSELVDQLLDLAIAIEAGSNSNGSTPEK